MGTVKLHISGYNPNGEIFTQILITNCQFLFNSLNVLNLTTVSDYSSTAPLWSGYTVAGPFIGIREGFRGNALEYATERGWSTTVITINNVSLFNRFILECSSATYLRLELFYNEKLIYNETHKSCDRRDICVNAGFIFLYENNTLKTLENNKWKEL